MALIVFRDNRWQEDEATLATMEVDLTHGSQMIYVIPEIMMSIHDFYRNIQISVLTRGYEAWQKSEANLLITRGQTEGSAGLDIAASHAAVIEPYGQNLINTGLRIEIPYGYYGRLTSRSRQAWKYGVEVGAGVIDSDYRGEVQVLLFN
ncbi:deoxyuridine 5'-triphosphate nucleotidohydrolase-like [Zingiber officinale]|uniref:deoxyuridine 5'-triphosphate nucleotidohydrolase-like n=1 Tax=Zingiber officinale TaxID=94328 RepID=UPI001C4AB745|nr:deoxyuridine 5'-triphosphate nucleotidohydrolase-like [Zingiber officinale]